MPGIFQGDIVLKTAIDLFIDDMRKNEWLIDHMLESLTIGPYVRDKYGKKQVDACKEWFRNNQIDVYVRPRDDKDRLPCITIELGGSSEKQEMRHMGDLSVFKRILIPQEINKPIPYVIPAFTPVGYTERTGLLEVPTSVDLTKIAAGMFLVNPATGNGYEILDINQSGIFVEPNLAIIASELAVLPKFQYYEARVEHSFFEESYNISCHGHGDIQITLWLWSIAKYSLLRYRQSLLEANGFAETHVHSSSPDLNYEMTQEGGDKVYTRSISITGQVENTWIKAPHRFIENSHFGIKIISNLNTPSFFDTADEPWTTAEDSGDDESE